MAVCGGGCVECDMRKRRRYSDEQRASAVAAVAANNGNVQGTATKLGIPHMTLKHWVVGEAQPEAMKDGNAKKPVLGDMFESIAIKLVGIADRKAEELNAKDAMIAAGVAVDKMRLLRGQSTAITEIDLTLLSDEQLDRIDRSYSEGTGLPPLNLVVYPEGEGEASKAV